MNNEYVIINKTEVLEEIESLKESLAVSESNQDKIRAGIEYFEIKRLEWCLSRSTPLIPEIEKAFTKGERYGWDSQKSIGNIDEMKEKIKLQSLDNYITNLKLSI